jgi:predicted nucleotide-binding protein (sugar kinase/HSP70/actin superfamily)
MQTNVTNDQKTVRLPIVGAQVASEDLSAADLDIEAEMARFEAEERARLGLDAGKKQWEDPKAPAFTASQRAHTTILISGLTVAHDHFIEGALSGLGYRVKAMDAPNNDALRFGKEFGNRGQCNPTYFTVGNLVKFVTALRDEQGMSTKDIINQYVFLTAGACGPCRFGMYATEYRKALRDAGFDGFRVILFQQQGGLKQASGDGAEEGEGLEMKPAFFIGLIKALIAGDVLNAVMYRLRPYEVVPGSLNEAVIESKRLIYTALRENRSVLAALWNVRRIMRKVPIDRTLPKPKVSVIGEFWAMTTEGDGNYQLQKFLESEGAEVDIQLVTAWILFMIWENVYDTRDRMMLRGKDTGRKSLKDPTDAARKLAKLWAADKAVRAIFQVFAHAVGLEGYKLSNMDEVAKEAEKYYNLNVRGGEAHMEVGKLVLTVKNKKATMVLSVKPFGCMPSSGVSDGVQSIVTERHPDAIFLPIETSGDGAVNVYSRVQMMLFKARQVAKAEVETALAETGQTLEQVKWLAAKLPWINRSLHHVPHSHVDTSTAAHFVREVGAWQKRLAPALKLAGKIPALARALGMPAASAPVAAPIVVSEAAPAAADAHAAA